MNYMHCPECSQELEGLQPLLITDYVHYPKEVLEVIWFCFKCGWTEVVSKDV